MSRRQIILLPSSSRRHYQRQEEVQARRRNAEWEKQQLWNGVTRYFHKWDVHATKHNEWSSPQMYNTSLEAYKKAVETQEKQQKLEERRQRLSALLFAEAKQYEQELSSLRNRPRSARSQLPLEELKMVNYELRRREEEAQRREAELRLYHHWRAKQPALRELEEKQHNHFVREAWVKQVQEKKEEREKSEREQMEAWKQREEQRLQEEQKLKDEQERTKQKAMDLQEQLKQQIQELREKERKTEELQKLEREALCRKIKLEDLIAERKLIEERQKSARLGSFLQRQYQLKLRQRVKEVQEQLAADLRLLERLLAEEVREEELKSESREVARQEMLNAYEALAYQAQLEKEREKQMEFLFHEEAERMWAKQKEQWELEKEARERLMLEVMATLQRQIEEKLEANIAKQKELVREREELVARLEQANADLHNEQVEMELAKERQRKQINSQVAEKQKRLLTEARIAELEAEKKKEEAKLEEERLLEELRRMEATGYNPKKVFRKRVIW